MHSKFRIHRTSVNYRLVLRNDNIIGYDCGEGNPITISLALAIVVLTTDEQDLYMRVLLL